MCKDKAFDLSKVEGSTYYARRNGQVVACRFTKLGVQRATIPTDKPHFFCDITFADGGIEKIHTRVMPRIYFTAEDAINDKDCIAKMQVCGYHRGLEKHGLHYAKELLDNGNKVKVGYIWNADEMKAVKVYDLPLFDYVNGKFYSSFINFETDNPMKVYGTMEECVQENSDIKVVEFD